MHVHFVGIGGIGMSGLARILLEEGCLVSGSDLQESAITRDLARAGVRVHRGHEAAQVEGAGMVVITSAAQRDNPEVLAAQAAGIPVVKRAELLGRLMRGRRGVAVAGSHGKTTTSSLIACILVAAGLDPTVLVGGEVAELGGNCRRGGGPVMVAEADEFDASFLQLQPEVAVVTNIEAEHLDYYRDFTGVVRAFGMFLLAVPSHGHIIYCLDDPVLAPLQSNQTRPPGANLNPTGSGEAPVLLTTALQAQSRISFGFNPAAYWSADALRPNAAGGFDFTTREHGAAVADIGLSIPGRHNVSNALAAIAAARVFGVEFRVIQEVLATFRGVKRRFDVLGEAWGVTVVDDYAHHPTEVAATLAAARARYGNRRLRCVFQPHTYSRTKLLEHLFRDAFVDADVVTVTAVYAAREENLWGASGEALARSLSHPNARYSPDLRDAVARETSELAPGDVLLVLGAGDVYRVGEQVLASLRGR